MFIVTVGGWVGCVFLGLCVCLCVLVGGGGGGGGVWLRPIKAVAAMLVKRFVYPIKMMKRPFISVALRPGADSGFTLTSFSNMRQRPTRRSAGRWPILDNTQNTKHNGVGTQKRLFTSNLISDQHQPVEVMYKEEG